MEQTTPRIDLTPCISSNIAAHGYDAASRTLAVQFSNGGLYHYHDVPADIAESFAQAESVGKFFSTQVRSQFKHTAIQQLTPD